MCHHPVLTQGPYGRECEPAVCNWSCARGSCGGQRLLAAAGTQRRVRTLLIASSLLNALEAQPCLMHEGWSASCVCNAVLAVLELYDRKPSLWHCACTQLLLWCVPQRALISSLPPASTSLQTLPFAKGGPRQPSSDLGLSLNYDVQAFQDAPEPQGLWIAVQQAAEAQGEVSAVNVQPVPVGT